MAGEWLAQLPADLQANEAFTGFATVGDFAKAHLEAKGKLSESEGKLTSLQGEFDTFKKNSIPKLPENATPEERDIYLMELGRPEKAEGYELDGEDKNAPEWTNFWKGEMFKLGLSKDTGKALSAVFNGQIARMVEAHNASVTREITEQSTKLKTELGDKYDTSVELAKRMWKTYADGDFDAAFKAETNANRYPMIRFLLKVAAKTGEDGSPPGSAAIVGKDGKPAGMVYDKSNMPPAKP